MILISSLYYDKTRARDTSPPVFRRGALKSIAKHAFQPGWLTLYNLHHTSIFRVQCRDTDLIKITMSSDGKTCLQIISTTTLITNAPPPYYSAYSRSKAGPAQ